MEYKAEDFISFIENNRRDKVSPKGLELIAKRFRELECEVNKFSLDAVSGSPYNYSKKDVRTNTKLPIKRGCSNMECFCTGKCNEIIGWRDKLPNEF